MHPPAPAATDAVALWASARSLYAADDFPPYSSPAWRSLPPDEPRRYAAVLEAAELWRRYQAERQRLDRLAETDPDAWFTEVTREANVIARRAIVRLNLAARPTPAELALARQALPPHRLLATAGWPPIAVPGHPGRYLQPGAGEAA